MHLPLNEAGTEQEQFQRIFPYEEAAPPLFLHE